MVNLHSHLRTRSRIHTQEDDDDNDHELEAEKDGSDFNNLKGAFEIDDIEMTMTGCACVIRTLCFRVRTCVRAFAHAFV